MLHVTQFLSALYGDKGLQPRFSGSQIVIVLACFFWNQQIAAAFSDTKIGRNYFFIFFGKKGRNMNRRLSFWKGKEERKEGKERRKGSICGSLNVPIEHHPTIRYMVYNGYYKVMSNIPKMGHLTTPGLSVVWGYFSNKWVSPRCGFGRPYYHTVFGDVFGAHSKHRVGTPYQTGQNTAHQCSLNTNVS